MATPPAHPSLTPNRHNPKENRMPETNGQPTTEWCESHPVVRASISIDAATLVPAVSADWIALRSRNGHGHVTFHGGHQAIREMLRAALAALPEEA